MNRVRKRQIQQEAARLTEFYRAENECSLCGRETDSLHPAKVGEIYGLICDECKQKTFGQEAPC